MGYCLYMFPRSWVFVPYVMIFIQWKKIGIVGKVIGSVWALFMIVSIVKSDKPVSTPQVKTEAVSTKPAETPKQESKQEPKEDAQKQEAAPKKEVKKDLELLEKDNVVENGVRYITGTIKNNTSKKYAYVQVDISLYDESGAQVGSTFANINNLEPDGTWKFKAVVLDDKTASKYKVTNISGW